MASVINYATESVLQKFLLKSDAIYIKIVDNFWEREGYWASFDVLHTQC